MNIDMIQIETSTYCGANCIMCPHDQYEYKNRHMSFDLFKKAVDFAGGGQKISVIDFDGNGDIFLDPGLMDKVKYVKHKYPELTTITTTTGHVIHFEALQYIDILKFSNYGFTKETYESVHRGSVNFDEAQSNMKKVLDLPDEIRPYTHMKYLILDENKHETEQWKEYWSNYKNVDELWIWKPFSWPHYYELESIDYSKVTPCSRVFHPVLQVKVTGEVSVCCRDIANQLIIGDLRHSTLEEMITDNQKIKRLQEVHQNKLLANCTEFEVCKTCDQITNRDHALVYSSKGRTVGAIALKDNEEVRY